MVEPGAETPSPILRSGPGGPGLHVPDDEGLRRDTQRKGGDDITKDPHKAQECVEEPLRQTDGNLWSGDSLEPIGICCKVGSRSSRDVGQGEGLRQVLDSSRF